jgi:tetratricopeptide (TPR) repeat protein
VLLAIAAGIAGTRAQEQAARREAARATAVKDVLVDLFESIHPQQAKGGKVLVEDLVARGEREIPAKFADQPALQYELLDLLANMRLALEQPQPRLAILERACPVAEAAHGDPSVALAECLTELADAQRVAQQLDAAGRSVARAFQISQRLQPADGVRLTEALRVQFALARDRGEATQAERIIRDGIARGRAFEGGMGVQTAFMLEDLAVFLPSQQRSDEALPLLEEILAFDREQPQARGVDSQINTRWNRLTHFWGKAQFTRTVEEADALAAFTAQALGRNHPHWFRCMQLRSLAQGRLGRYREAVEALDAVLAVDGIDEWSGGRYRQLLGAERVLLLPAVGRAADAEANARAVLALTDRQSLPRGSALVATFGATLAALSRHDPAAIAEWRAELERRYAALTPAEQGTYRNAMLQLRATALRVAGEPRAALPLLEEAALGYRLPDGSSSQRAERALAEQGFALLEAGDAVEAASRLRAARALLVTRFPDGHPGTAQIDVALATLPASLSTPEERARRESAAARFLSATGRAVDAFVLL